jgi:hypothetical protein
MEGEGAPPQPTQLSFTGMSPVVAPEMTVVAPDMTVARVANLKAKLKNMRSSPRQQDGLTLSPAPSAVSPPASPMSTMPLREVAGGLKVKITGLTRTLGQL